MSHILTLFSAVLAVWLSLPRTRLGLRFEQALVKGKGRPLQCLVEAFIRKTEETQMLPSHGHKI